MRADIQYLTSKELAARWKISVWSVNHLAKHRRIRGAVKPGRDWRFPDDAELLPPLTAASPEPTSDPDAALAAFLKRLDAK